MNHTKSIRKYTVCAQLEVNLMLQRW